MRVAVFSTKPYDRQFLDAANAAAGHQHRLTYIEAHLSPETAALSANADAVCAFVNDQLDAAVLRILGQSGVRLVALRCAGFNNVDLAAAKDLGITVARVPAYSPHAVAEHTVALILALNRKIHRAYNRVREGQLRPRRAARLRSPRQNGGDRRYGRDWCGCGPYPLRLRLPCPRL